MSKVKLPVQKNEIYEGRVEDLTSEAHGVVKIDRYPIFIPFALEGELIRFKVVKTNKKLGFGILLDVLEASPDRVEGIDRVYHQTGTMPLQHMSYESQLSFKRDQVKRQLQRVAGIDIPVLDTLGMEKPYGYRNKAQIPVHEINGQLETGFYRQRSHDLIPVENFKIQDPEIDRAIIIVRDLLRKYNVEAYNEIALDGVIRHIVVRRGYYTGELMLVFVTNGWEFPYAEEIVEELKIKLTDLVSVIQNNNPRNTNVILGRDSRLLYGEDFYQDKLFNYTFKISHQSFYQINPTQTEKLYQTAIDYAELTGEELVIDAYCGIGTMTIALAEKAKEVHGIEIVPPAIENANENKEINNIENVSFQVGAAENVMMEYAEEGRHVDVVVVDPPRKGLDEQFLEAAVMMAPERFIYVSCNPATLARDVKYLVENGYEAIKAQPIDMFPQTTHVECVVLMSKIDE